MRRSEARDRQSRMGNGKHSVSDGVLEGKNQFTAVCVYM